MTKETKSKNDNSRFLARRKALGLTHQQVANYIGVSTATVSRWENGITCDLPFSKVVKYAEILQVSPLWILDPNEYKCIISQNVELRHSKNFDFDLQQFILDYFDLITADSFLVKDSDLEKKKIITTLIAIIQNLPIGKLIEILPFCKYKFDQEYGTKTELEQMQKIAELIKNNKDN